MHGFADCYHQSSRETQSQVVSKLVYYHLNALIWSSGEILYCFFPIFYDLKEKQWGDKNSCRYGDLYSQENVAISGIHTHAGPGGYLQYVTYIVTSLGFVRQSFDVLVDGIEKTIVQAHENLRPGSILVNEGMHIHPPLHLSHSFLYTL